MFNFCPVLSAERVRLLGEQFDSKKEGYRYLELLAMAREGTIRDLQRQVPFELLPATNTDPSVAYVADFVYYRRGHNDKYALIIEDVKGMRLPLYRLKKRLMKEMFGLEIEEV